MWTSCEQLKTPGCHALCLLVCDWLLLVSRRLECFPGVLKSGTSSLFTVQAAETEWSINLVDTSCSGDMSKGYSLLSLVYKFCCSVRCTTSLWWWVRSFTLYCADLMIAVKAHIHPFATLNHKLGQRMFPWTQNLCSLKETVKKQVWLCFNGTCTTSSSSLTNVYLHIVDEELNDYWPVNESWSSPVFHSLVSLVFDVCKDKF